jgi:hypothetical protein
MGKKSLEISKFLILFPISTPIHVVAHLWPMIHFDKRVLDEEPSHFVQSNFVRLRTRVWSIWELLLTATVKKWELTYQAVKDIKGLKMVLNWVQDDEPGCSCQADPGSDL